MLASASTAATFQPTAGFLQVTSEPADAFTAGDKQGREQDQDHYCADHGFSSLVRYHRYRRIIAAAPEDVDAFLMSRCRSTRLLKYNLAGGQVDQLRPELLLLLGGEFQLQADLFGKLPGDDFGFKVGQQPFNAA